MTSLALAGLFSFFLPWQQKPAFAMPQWAEQPAQPIRLAKSKKLDLAGRIHVLGKLPKRVREYSTPAAQVFADGSTLKNFAWRGSMEGVTVGSNPHTSKGMRSKHKAIRVKLEKLFCEDVGEDAISIQPRSVVTVRDSKIRGNWRRGKKDDAEAPGQDKLVQIDGANVTIENCDFFNGCRAIRGKANSTITIKNCRFVRCSTCVLGDGLANPDSRSPYDNGKRGICTIRIIDCEVWDSDVVATAMEGCQIEIVNLKTHRTREIFSDRGGSVTIKAN